MWIYLLRHGIAEDHAADVPDEDRALTDEGRKRLRRAARSWQRLVDAPDVIVTSPLRRARETAEVFVEAVRFAGNLRIDNALVPGATPSLAVTLLEAELLAGTDSVVLIGHEPHLGHLLGALLTGQPRVAVPMKKGMLVALEAENSTSVQATLRFALTQRAAGRLA